MVTKSIARNEIRNCKTLGLLGEIFLLSMKMKKEGTPFLPLQLGDPAHFDFPPIPSFKEGILKALDNPLSFAYGNPQGYPPLLEKIAELEGVDPSYVFIGNGVSDIMDKIMNVTAVKGTNILFPAPVFPPYLDLNKKNSIESRLYHCDLHTWQPDIASIESKIDDSTSMILVNSPNNPTGAVYSEETMVAIIDLAEQINQKRRLLTIPPLCLIFDAIYSEHYFDDKPVDVKKLLHNKELTWILLNGASKSFNVPGLRLGYAILGGVERDALREVLYNECILPLCMNSIFQEGYLAALLDPTVENYFRENRAKLKKRRDLMLNGLGQIPGISVVKPEGAFYMVLEMATEFTNDRELGIALLTEEKICTSQMSAFFDKETLPDSTSLRLAILPTEEVLEDALFRLSRFMQKHGNT